MKKENLRILFAGLAVSLFPVFAYAQVQDVIVPGETPIFVNKGAMRVAANGDLPTMLITRSLAVHDGSDILTDENSQIDIGGSVYQSASFKVVGGTVVEGSDSKGFSVKNDGTPKGEGTIAFVDVEGVSNALATLDDWHNEGGGVNGNRVGTGIATHVDDDYHSDGSGTAARYITALNSAPDATDYPDGPFGEHHDDFMGKFQRSKNYIAFPKIKIDTDNKIMLPAKMGIDAKKIEREPGKLGVFYLESAPLKDGEVHDASLRITDKDAGGGSAESSARVTQGAVLIERDVTVYRGMLSDGEDPNSGDYAWMPFTSPFDAAGGSGGLRSGYFAGNFVRKVLSDERGHVEHVYANPPAKDGFTIDRSVYITDASTPLDPVQAYVISLRHQGYLYSGLTDGGGLWWTDHTDEDEHTGSGYDHYDRNVFVFGDKLYAKDKTNKQLYARTTLFDSAKQYPGLDLTDVDVNNPINWVIGNSYTAGIDIAKLATAMKGSSLEFGNVIYVFCNDANQNYIPVSVADASGEPRFDITELDAIPTQHTFLLQVIGGSTERKFEITKEMLVHGDREHNFSASPAPSPAKGDNFSDEVLFAVSPVNNPKQRDVTLMGFRSKAKGTYDDVDLRKMYNTSGNAFQLYSTSDDNQRLAGNAMSFGRENAPLSFRPSSEKADFVISTSRLESLNTEIVFLEDLKAKTFTDLRVKGEYEFTAAPSDNANRFIVHFTKKSLDGKIPVKNDDLNIFYDNGDVVVKSLLEQDKGSLLIIANAQGKIVANGTVSASDVDSAEMRLPVSLVDGVYVASLKGNRNVSKKFVVKPRLQ